ncbi:MAG: tRNA epoxyqueuosine(34) reductase QueG [Bacteroidia bacterium]|nr:tRNA epoxyqueuosine(34) reductase QueG [Bacteroidia bacterium]
MNLQLNNIREKIRNYALSIGFEAVGFARAEPLDTEAKRLEYWLMNEKHADMAWMQNTFDIRTNPLLLLPEAKTIIVGLVNYFGGNNHSLLEVPRISRYAWGKDYHYVIRAKFQQVLSFIESSVGKSVAGRIVVDSAPFMDKVWAVRAGLGWIGKNTILIRRKSGSWFFIGALLIDLPLEPDNTVSKDYCGQCTRCIDACPTQAISPYQVDANQCISYLTIEKKEDISSELSEKLKGWAFGCDICQEVCPWNSFATLHTIAEFEPLSILSEFKNPLITSQLTKSQFYKRTQISPISRVRLPKWVSNIDLAVKSTQQPNID